MTITKTGTSLIATAALLSACAFLVLSDRPAFAEDGASNESDNFAFTYSYAPEDLDSLEKADALLSRLQHQVWRQCKTDGRVTVAERKLTDECIDATLAATVRKIGSSTLATVYENRTDG